MARHKVTFLLVTGESKIVFGYNIWRDTVQRSFAYINVRAAEGQKPAAALSEARTR